MRRSKKIQTRRGRKSRSVYRRRVQKTRRVKSTYRKRQRGGLSINAHNAQNNNAANENVNLGLIQDLYSAIDDVENAEERVNILKAVGGWLYAIFYIGKPEISPGNTKEGMIMSFLFEAEHDWGYELDRQTDDFNAVIDELYKLYSTILTYEEEENIAAVNQLREMHQQYQDEYEAQYIQ